MNNDFEHPKVLRLYLLGALDDEIVKTRIEEHLIANDDTAALLSTAEEALIEEFLDGEMDSDDTAKFNEFFLAPPERRRQLRLTQDLRTYASRSATRPETGRSLSEAFHPLTNFRWLRFAVVGAVVIAVGLAFWRFAYYEDDTAKGIAQLQAMYRDDRPFRSRVTLIPDYAPFSETRGAEKTPDPTLRDRAQRYLFDATANNTESRAHHALAMYYLTAREYDKARAELDLAVKSAPNDAKLQSDAGAAFLEMSRDAKARSEGAKSLRLLDESIGHLDRAMALDAKLLEPRFNKALALHELMLPEQEKNAWRDYLRLDATSKWADEARSYLQTLESQTPKERTADELEADFLDAFRAGDDATASRLIADNRELIREKYLPQRLAMSYTAATDPARRDELLRAMQYAGNLELNQTGDPFANDIARFYLSASTETLAAVGPAHTKVREGNAAFLDQRYGDGLAAYQAAQKIFERAGYEQEARLCQYNGAYGLINTERTAEASAQLGQIVNFAQEHRYDWLRMTALYWVGGTYRRSKQVAESREANREALAIARRIGDSYGARRSLFDLAESNASLGMTRESLDYLADGLVESAKGTSFRQRYRDVDSAVSVFYSADLMSLVGPGSMECVLLADGLKDSMWRSQSRAQAAAAVSRSGDIDGARKLLDESRTFSESIKDPGSRALVTAFSDRYRGDLERASGNFAEAESWYNRALEYFNGTDRQGQRELANNGLLLSYLALGREGDLEKQIPTSVSLSEEYRTTRLSEPEQIGFFETQQNIYDIASRFELSRGNAERAYEYAERSTSRVLLERMRTGSTVYERSRTVNEIREMMPNDAQLLQYTVFEDEVAIWVITKNTFHSGTVKITAADLTKKVTDLATAISAREAGTAAGRDLYDILIEPVRAQLDPSMELCVVPSKLLFDVPFAALLSPDGRPFIENFRIVYAPSASVFVQASRTAQQRAEQDDVLLAVGNPSFDRDKYSGLPQLVDAEKEAAAIAAMYRHSLTLIADRATKDAFLEQLPNATIVHFAGHYVVAPNMPEASRMLFARGSGGPGSSELTNSELDQLDLNKAKLIVLAACDSGVESIRASEGMIGASRAVLATRAPLVIASQWNVDTAATAELMTRFHRARTTSVPSTEALRHAQLSLLNDPSGRFSSPYYWAAFAAYGGHAGF